MRRKKRPENLTLADVEEWTGIHPTINHTGKMRGMMSLSTSCLCNERCQEYRKDPEKICHYCYAAAQQEFQRNLEKCLRKNTEILTSKILEKKDLPIINAAYFRFEAFGDLNNETQCINYFNICKANKHVSFALWTKNPDIIKRVIEAGHKKPKNLIIVLSSFYLNVAFDPATVAAKWPFVNKIFTVYTKEYVKDHPEIVINCGGRSCLICGCCYKKNKAGTGLDIINEIKK